MCPQNNPVLAGLAASASPGSQNTDTCPLAHLGLRDSAWVVRIVSGAPGQAQRRGRHVHHTGPCHLASSLNSRSRMPTNPTCRGGARSQHLSREPGAVRVPEAPGMLSLPCQVPPFPSPSPALAQAPFGQAHTLQAAQRARPGFVPGWYSRSCRRAGAARAL